MQQYGDISLLLNYSTCFGRPSLPSSGVHKTSVAASGTDHTIREANFLKRDQIRNPDDGRDDARNMQSNLAVNKYLHTVASCWIYST
jgi:hypothetical protein